MEPSPHRRTRQGVLDMRRPEAPAPQGPAATGNVPSGTPSVSRGSASSSSANSMSGEWLADRVFREPGAALADISRRLTAVPLALIRGTSTVARHNDPCGAADQQWRQSEQAGERPALPKQQPFQTGSSETDRRAQTPQERSSLQYAAAASPSFSGLQSRQC